ncbi:hypothetical protein [Halomontanus rarus]|uniref:hypothetical protein n=1 Tax=Halomontanus rarus TaxID=3034020 RepID=UPI0023E7FCD3|nr:hypothetical protein [Halovivax sp. TS33]
MTDSFLEILCVASHLFRRVFQIAIVLLVLLAFSVVAIEPGTPTYYIAIVNVLVLVPLLIASAGTIYYCETARERKKISLVESAREHDEASDERPDTE